MSHCPHNSLTDGHLENRAQLDPRLEGLPQNSGGLSRESCVYCAYERGWADAMEAIARRFESMLKSVEPDVG